MPTGTPVHPPWLIAVTNAMGSGVRMCGFWWDRERGTG